MSETYYRHTFMACVASSILIEFYRAQSEESTSNAIGVSAPQSLDYLVTKANKARFRKYVSLCCRYISSQKSLC